MTRGFLLIPGRSTPESTCRRLLRGAGPLDRCGFLAYVSPFFQLRFYIILHSPGFCCLGAVCPLRW